LERHCGKQEFGIANNIQFSVNPILSLSAAESLFFATASFGTDTDGENVDGRNTNRINPTGFQRLSAIVRAIDSLIDD
jgi:hypothetical protein